MKCDPTQTLDQIRDQLDLSNNQLFADDDDAMISMKLEKQLKLEAIIVNSNEVKVVSKTTEAQLPSESVSPAKTADPQSIHMTPL